MCEAECLLGYLEVTRQTLKNHGVPLSLYPDKYGVISIHKCRFVISDNNVPPRAKVTILLSRESGMRAEYKGKLYPVHLAISSKSSLETNVTFANVTKKLMQEYFFKDAKAA